jgi:hypothetical protein
MGDGRILPLAIGEKLELPVASDNATGGFLTVLPGTESHVLIELTPVWSAVALSGSGPQLLPTLTGRALLVRDY